MTLRRWSGDDGVGILRHRSAAKCNRRLGGRCLTWGWSRQLAGLAEGGFAASVVRQLLRNPDVRHHKRSQSALASAAAV
jgi:hypothetical protein